MSADSRLRWLGTVTEIVPVPTPPKVAIAKAVEWFKAIQEAGPTHTLIDLIDSPYARMRPHGKTIHVVEHRIDQCGGGFAACCSELFVTRLKGGPAEIVSRIHFPTTDRKREDSFWRVSGNGAVDDGFDHPVIRRRVDQLVALLESRKHFSHGPLRPGPHSRQGARDIEVKNRFDLTLQWLSAARQFEFREEIVLLRRAIRVRVLNELRQPVARTRVSLVNHDSNRTLPATTDSHGDVTFADLPPGNYGVRAYDADGALIGSKPARPETHRFMRLHHDPIPVSTAWASYLELHRAARAAGQRPTENAATEWLKFFFNEFLDRDDRRSAVVETVRRRASTGRGRFRAAFRYPQSLAEALTAAHVGMTVKAVRNAVAALERRSGRT